MPTNLPQTDLIITLVVALCFPLAAGSGAVGTSFHPDGLPRYFEEHLHKGTQNADTTALYSYRLLPLLTKRDPPITDRRR